MISYLTLYAEQWAALYRQAEKDDRRSLWSILGILPHEVAAMNARQPARRASGWKFGAVNPR